MKKSEIKQGVKTIAEAISCVRDNIEEYLQSYNEIKEHLDVIQEIEEENSIDTGIDYEMIKNDILRSCVNENGDIQYMIEQFESLISDLECWQEDSSENKSDEIQEKYIDILNEIQENFDVDAIECEEDLDNQLFDMLNQLEVNQLEDMEI